MPIFPIEDLNDAYHRDGGAGQGTINVDLNPLILNSEIISGDILTIQGDSGGVIASADVDGLTIDLTNYTPGAFEVRGLTVDLPQADPALRMAVSGTVNGVFFAGGTGVLGGSTVDTTAIYELISTSRGFLPPRMNTTQRDAIGGGSPATGLVIYNTTVTALQYFDGTAWITANNSLVTLDTAYDGTGSGAGRTVTVDSGAVELSNPGATADMMTVDEGGGNLAALRSDGDLVLGGSAMSGTERLRVVGTTRFEGSTTLTVGQHLVPDGTNGAPSYSFTNETTMGIYRDSAGVLGLSASGGEGFTIDRTNNVDGLTSVGDFVVLRPLGIGTTNVGVAMQFDFGLGGAIARVNMQPQAGNSIGSFFLSPSGTQTRTFFQMRNDSDQSNTGRLIFDFAAQIARLTTDTGGTGLSATDMEFGETGGSGTGGYGTLTDIGFFFSGVREVTINSSGQVATGFGTSSLPGLAFTGDEDTGLYRPSANIIAITTGTTEALRVNASQQILIGTTSPAASETLNVAGETRITSGNLLVSNVTVIGGTAPVGAEVLRTVGDSRFEGQTEIKDHSSFTSSEAITTTDAVATTDATQTTIWSLTLSDDTIYVIEAHISARQTNASNRAGYVRRVTVYREGGGGATLQGAVDAPYTEESNANWDATFDVSSNDIRLRITGDTTQNVSWVTTVEYQAVSSSA